MPGGRRVFISQMSLYSLCGKTPFYLVDILELYVREMGLLAKERWSYDF